MDVFFSSLKLQYCQTIVLQNKLKLKLFKETSFSKATVVMRFPAKKNGGCPKAPSDFPPRKDGILHPPSGCLGTPRPLPQSLYGRAGGRAGGSTLTTQPKFFCGLCPRPLLLDGTPLPRLVTLGLPSGSPRVCMDGQKDVHRHHNQNFSHRWVANFSWCFARACSAAK